MFRYPGFHTAPSRSRDKSPKSCARTVCHRTNDLSRRVTLPWVQQAGNAIAVRGFLAPKWSASGRIWSVFSDWRLCGPTITISPPRSEAKFRQFKLQSLALVPDSCRDLDSISRAESRVQRFSSNRAHTAHLWVRKSLKPSFSCSDCAQ